MPRIDKNRSVLTPLEPISLHKTENTKMYSVWQPFGKAIQCVKENRSFEDVQLLLRSERGRVTRSGSVFGCDRDEFECVVTQRFRAYRIYLDLLISELINRFEPWPEWLMLCQNCFNFRNTLEFIERRESFTKLLNLPFGISPLIHEEKERLNAEYITMHRNAQRIREQLEDNAKIEKNWYVLLTESKYYENCKFINYFALQFLNRSFNECVVECEVSNFENIQTSSRHLTDKNAEMLNFISSNGPHPLVSQRLVDDFLTNHFGKNWHFTTSTSSFFISKTVDRHFQCAKSQPNSLQ